MAPVSRSSGLNPRWYDASLPIPPWVRSTRIRRILAAALVVLAAVAAVRGDPSADPTTVVVAARDLAPGYVLTASDVTTAALPHDAVPDGATFAVADAVGRTVAGPIRAGETFTDVRLLGPRLVEAALSIPDGRVVPVRVADPMLADIVRAGDSVDVLTVGGGPAGPESAASGADTGGSDTGTARVLATGATVVMVPTADTATHGRERLVLLALGPEAATTVAAASLVSALTLTLH